MSNPALKEFDSFNLAWGNRGNIFEIGNKLSEISYYKKPRKITDFSEQIELMFGWFNQTFDRRTRVVTKLFFQKGWERATPQEKEKMIASLDSEGGSATLRTYDTTELYFSEDFIEDWKQYRVNLDLGEFEDLHWEYYFWAFEGPKDPESDAKYWSKDARMKEFVEKHGEFRTVTVVEKLIWKPRHSFWSYEFAMANGNRYTHGLEKQYLMMNVLYKIPKKEGKRRTEFVTELNALYTELDYYKQDKYKDVDQKIMKKMVFDKLHEAGFPIPSEVVYSRGLQLIWRISPIGSKKAPYWEMLQRKIHEILKDFGADSVVITDKVRVLRALGSIHSTTKQAIFAHSYMPSHQRYDFQELLDTFCGGEVAARKHWIEEQIKQQAEKAAKRLEKTERKFKVLDGKAKNKGKSNVWVKKASESKWNVRHQRLIHDIFKLLELRNGDLTGCREFALFLVRYWTLCVTGGDTESALDQMRKVYELMTNYDNDNGQYYGWEFVKYATKSAEAGYQKWEDHQVRGINKSGFRYAGYNYSPARLIEELHVTKEEMTYLKAIMDAEEVERRKPINEARKYENKKAKRRSEGMVSHAEKRTRIAQYFKDNPGANNTQASKDLGISRPTIIKFRKENGI